MNYKKCSFKNKMAFTLIELIVTIGILAILWTIAFFALQGYSQNSRDSVRISDLSIMKNWLDLYVLDWAKYPDPTNKKEITYSWWTVWIQWSFWESTTKNVDKINKIPTDPLLDKEYTYSITKNWREYEIWGIVEWDSFANIKLINNSYAWTNSARALIIWNYNWLVATSSSWSNCNVLTVPTIIANDIDTSTNYEEIINNHRLVFNWYNNLPNSFKNTKFKMDWWFDFNPNKLLIHSGSCSELETDEFLRIQILKDIQSSYSWTILKNNSTQWTLLWLNIDTSNPNDNVKSLATNISSILLWKKLKWDYSIDLLMWLCSINWVNVNNWEKIMTYSESSIDNLAAYDCTTVSQEKTCTNWVLSWASNYIFTSCVKWVVNNCSAQSSFIYNLHTYNVPLINHAGRLTNITSANINQNNWLYTYKLNSIWCNDWAYISINEDISPTLVSCNNWFIASWNSCITQWEVNITSTGGVICSFCTN